MTSSLYLACDVAAIWGDDALDAISHPELASAVVATDLGRWVEFTRHIINGKIRYSAVDKGPIVSAILVTK